MEECVNETALLAGARQMAFIEFLDGRNWHLDLDTGFVKFGDDLSFPIQLLGSSSDISNTWLWAWANSMSNIPSERMEKVLLLKDYGRDHDIAEFNIPQIPIEGSEDHMLAMICSELLGGVPYYRGPYANGAVFFLVLDTPSMNTRIETVRIPRILITTFHAINVTNHRKAVLIFLDSWL
jgi:hypothetical protein